jgi:hypothetical protein
MTYDFIKSVDQIITAFPLGRLEPSKSRLRAMWDLSTPPWPQLDRLPFFFTGVPFEHRFGPGIGEMGYPHAETLEFLLEAILARSIIDDDYIPSLAPGIRQGLIPTAYGAQESWDSDHFWVKPLVSSAREFLALPHPDFSRDGWAAEVLAMIRFFRQATGRRLPIQMPDMQGPLDLAANLLGTERLIEEMVDHPQDVQTMLRQLADDFNTFMRLVEAAAEGDLVPIHCHPMVWLPKESGMALSEDLLAVISPRLYRKFGVPYNERIAAEFGGVIIHSCGSIEHNLAELAQTRRLVGVNFSLNETDVNQAARILGDQAVLIIHPSPVSCHRLPILKAKEFVSYIFGFIKQQRKQERARVIPLIAPDAEMSTSECIELCQVALQLSSTSK